MSNLIAKAALAGLLHDIGKIAVRAGLSLSGNAASQPHKHAAFSAQFVRDYVPAALEAGLTGPQQHHTPQTQHDWILAAANRLASGENQVGVEDVAYAQATAQMTLGCIFDDVILNTTPDPTRPRASYGLKPLSLEKEAIFPQVGKINQPADYGRLWDEFCRAAAQFKHQSDIEAYILSLQSLLRRHTTFVPAGKNAATGLADISLYDHARVTAAIAACLQAACIDKTCNEADLKQWANATPKLQSPLKPAAILCRGGFNRIQSYIYRVTRSEDDKSFEKVAKALRGRSFYVGILSELIARWILRELGLPITNLLFVGGGRFDLLLPNTAAVIEKLPKIQEQIDAWMLRDFDAELGLRLVHTPVVAADFDDLSQVYDRLDADLEKGKLSKWQQHLKDPAFFTPEPAIYDACKMTGLPLKLGENGISRQCASQIKIGQALPHTHKIAIIWDNNTPLAIPNDVFEVSFAAAPFQAQVLLLEQKADLAQILPKTLNASQVELRLIRDTDTAPHASPRYGVGFQFLANTVPTAQTRINHPDDIIDVGDVVHFGQIGSMSDGSEVIGILKADVDHLGLIFGLGLRHGNNHPTLARVSTMSSLLDVFFCGWLNEICHQMHFEGGGSAQVSQRFYVLYSGGDDLFIIGPWNDIINLSKRLTDDFTEFVHANPNVTLSAGVVMVKPHFPVQRFAELAESELKKAKSAGRNRVTVFGCTLTWAKYAESLAFAKKLHGLVQAKTVPRGLVHDLGQVYRQHFGPLSNPNNKPMWTPRLHYALTRRLNRDIRTDIQAQVFTQIQEGSILLPVSYVSLITR